MGCGSNKAEADPDIMQLQGPFFIAILSAPSPFTAVPSPPTLRSALSNTERVRTFQGRDAEDYKIKGITVVNILI